MISFIKNYKYLILSFIFLGLFLILYIDQKEPNVTYDTISPAQEEQELEIALEEPTSKVKAETLEVVDYQPKYAVHESKVKRIIINDKEINQEVIPVGVDDEGRVATADNAYDLTWYARTGEKITNIIIAGHRDWADQTGIQIGVLSGSELWDKGLELELEFENGKKETFELAYKYNYSPEETPSEIMNTETGEYRVTLITCGGNFKRGYGYEERIYNVFTFKEDI